MTDLHYHTQERFLVLGPQSGQLLSRGEQTAASVDRDLRTVSKVHAEVLGGTRRNKMADWSARTAIHLKAHGQSVSKGCVEADLTFMLPMWLFNSAALITPSRILAAQEKGKRLCSHNPIWW